MTTGTIPELGIGQDVVSLIAMISPGVVGIGRRRDLNRRSKRGIESEIEGPTLGAGLVWSRPPHGGTLVVTNAHVVDALGDATVAVFSAADITFGATVCAVDRARDIALLRVSEHAPQLTPLAISCSPVAAGEFVLAIGHPLGIRNAVTSGVVHSVGPVHTLAAMPAAQRALEWLQIDVLLGPGNSGGPVIDAQGRVVGMNTMIAAGLALAIPARAIDEFAHAYLRGVFL